MSKFKSLEKLDKKEAFHRTKVGKQTSSMTAKHVESRKGASAFGTSSERKTGGKVPDKKR